MGKDEGERLVDGAKKGDNASSLGPTAPSNRKEKKEKKVEKEENTTEEGALAPLESPSSETGKKLSLIAYPRICRGGMGEGDGEKAEEE